MKLFETNDSFMKIIGFPVYIISLHWFTQWQKYINQYNQDMKNEHTYENQYKDPCQDNHYPGPIDNYDIIEYNLQIKEDPDQLKKYTKYCLRNNFFENKHFVIISSNAARYLCEKYGYLNLIQRLVIKANESVNIVEVNLLKVGFYLIQENSKIHLQEPEYVQASKKEFVSNLQSRICRILDKEGEQCKLWKVERNKIEKIQKQIQNQNFQKPTFISGNYLDQNKILEEIEINYESIILIEFKGNQQDWVFEEEIILEKKQLMDIFKIKLFHKSQPGNARNGICGLQNLGNTCFMNSSIQCLSNIQELTNYMKQNLFLDDINRDNPLGTGGYLAAAYAELIKNIWLGSNSCESPWELKRIVGKFAPQFSGFNQQDSQELLSYLLDGIHEDLNKILKKTILRIIRI
ncbi:ubiquitin carboxyl-terminal hydrolase family protein, putative [Ichthyophthirius multifiliis]|uniref:ubiquitinyl hydrolase 1 n=1 Tax=Ichthyophthirius multifiliis TaxID=5932 RepID=G0R027_ICHMU|nr:ubiquitin carboxyl-terminal hydrolase family protein, putative [Ichthyophthirius multifiliis]EGR29185.1 ubiquitin carboxyl-terminal hydrolase family protein, putative [Ichthyophthirius multifiliis]|eukprot:XP_004030421.1 ubiquitin carboxyl-terminal hydrolase family protein, putative [Ichthyophthirius multifiliis]